MSPTVVFALGKRLFSEKAVYKKSAVQKSAIKINLFEKISCSAKTAIRPNLAIQKTAIGGNQLLSSSDCIEKNVNKQLYYISAVRFVICPLAL